MKKLMIALAMCGLTMNAMAQDADPVEKYSVSTNSFWSNWFIQGGVDWSAWYSNEEHGLGLSHSPLKKFRSNPGASIAVGKWFTPGLGLRTKIQGIWGKRVTDGDNNGNGMMYWTANEQIMFNMSNLLCGYNPNRVWNVIPFIGGGFTRDMTDACYSMQLSIGVQSLWNINRHVGIYLEGGWNRLEDDGDSRLAVNTANGGNRQNFWERSDNHVYAELGVNINLGKATWNKTPDVDAIKAMSQSQIDALNSQLNDANSENARLKKLLDESKRNTNTKTVKEVASTPVSVFFNIGKSKVASKKDLVNVQSLAKYAKDNNSKLTVTGYADSATGSADFNQKLSEDRANAVADELVKLGVSRDNITTTAKGGVDELSPVSYNRRATVQIAE